MKDDALLNLIVDYCEEIQYDQKRFGNSLDDFLEDLSYRKSCCMTLIQIGEAVRKLSQEFTEQHDEIDWVSVIGFRNIVVHRYESIDSARIWEIIAEDIPTLKSVCEKILSGI